MRREKEKERKRRKKRKGKKKDKKKKHKSIEYIPGDIFSIFSGLFNYIH